MSYKLLYHHKVKQDDLPLIDSSIKKRIFTTIESRLTTEPQQYGKPLRKPLSGYWKLRIGDYRVVYKIVKKEVWILAILHREKIYPFAIERAKE
jgi:mRNA interferase RelE/StbE